MAHAQNSPRGLNAKKEFRITASGKLYFEDYSSSNALLQAAASGLKLYGGLALSAGTNYITDDGTNVVLPAGVKVSNKANAVLTGNSTGIAANGSIQVSAGAFIDSNATSALETTDQGAAFRLFSNSTGVTLQINSTGTTWKYVSLTSVQNT